MCKALGQSSFWLCEASPRLKSDERIELLSLLYIIGVYGRIERNGLYADGLSDFAKEILNGGSWKYPGSEKIQATTLAATVRCPGAA